MIDDCFVICKANDKAPIGNEWGKHPLSLAEVERRRANNPSLNNGIILGPTTGLIDLECDSAEATANLQALVGEHTGPSWTSTRGNHYLFAWDDRFTQQKIIYRGIECRLGGGGKQTQSICPPSTVDGIVRTWINDLSHAAPPLPESLIQELLALADKTTATFDGYSDPLFASVEAQLHAARVKKLSDYLTRANVPFSTHTDYRRRTFLEPEYCVLRGPAHTDGGSAIIINTDGSFAWKCFHSHCEDKTFRDVEDVLGPLNPVIKIGDLDENVREAISALGKAHNVFQRGGVLVSIAPAAPVPPMACYSNGGPKLVPFSTATLAPTLSSCAKWQRWNDKSKKWKSIIPPTNVVCAVNESAKLPGIPTICGIINSPALRSDGSIVTRPGYDHATGLYLDSDGEFPPLMEVGAAVAALDDVLADFPFAKPAHKSGAVALMVTMMARAAFAGPSPMFLVDANASRAGKGLLTDTATMIVEGRKAARYTPPTSDDEFRKTITSAALSGATYVIFDNIKGKFGGQAIENAITTGRWSDRLLGANMSIDVELCWTWAGTANNAILTPDMIGRTLHVRLDVREERPELRTGFRHSDLLAHVKKHRRRLAIAALSIPAQFIRAGRPAQNLPAWGGFEQWSALVRGSLVWAGMADPGETRAALREQADDDTAILQGLMDGWRELGFPATVTAALTVLDGNLDDTFPMLRAAVAELTGDRKNALGNTLKRFRGRVLGGHHFERTDHKIPKWEVREVRAA